MNKYVKVSFCLLIGFLAFSIALPNLLGRSCACTREDDGRGFVGALTRSQQGYFTEHNQFASNLDFLEVPIGNEKYHRVDMLETKPIVILRGIDNKRHGTKDFIGGTSYDKDSKTFSRVICRSNQKPYYIISDPSKAIINAGVVHNSKVQCGEGVTEIH